MKSFATALFSVLKSTPRCQVFLWSEAMETLSKFFEWLNRLFGVQGPGELIFHPVFIGICVALFLYAIVKRMQFLTLAVGGLMGGALIVNYLYPANVSHLTDLIVFIGAMGGLALVLVYFAFVRE
jgi:hypothetical protein